MGLLDVFEKRKKELLLKKIELQKEEAHSKGRFSILDASFAKEMLNSNMDYKNLLDTYGLIAGWDSYCKIPYDAGFFIDKLSSDMTVMVHRTRLDLDTSVSGLENNENLVNIMNGLYNTGDLASSGFYEKTPELTKTSTPLVGLAGYINMLSSYKENDTIILMAFPKDLVDKDGKLVHGHDYSAIYDLSDTTRVKKEFMVGAILKKDNGLYEFYTREEIIDEYSSTKAL